MGSRNAKETAKILKFDHTRKPSALSAGKRSGRSSERETPVALSIGNTNSAATPLLDRLSQYQTSDCLVPMREANTACPPAISHARLSASTDMGQQYPDLGRKQPKNMSGTNNPNFGRFWGMKTDPKGFGDRVRQRREEFRWSQEKLAKESGKSQSNIEWIENGGPKDPRKQALALAEALLTTPDWLLTGKGKKDLAPDVMTREQLQEEYEAMSGEDQFEMRKAITAWLKEAHARRSKREG